MNYVCRAMVYNNQLSKSAFLRDERSIRSCRCNEIISNIIYNMWFVETFLQLKLGSVIIVLQRKKCKSETVGSLRCVCWYTIQWSSSLDCYRKRITVKGCKETQTRSAYSNESLTSQHITHCCNSYNQISPFLYKSGFNLVRYPNDIIQT